MVAILMHLTLWLGASDLPPATAGTELVEQNAREYRITLYERFRTDRPRYDELFGQGEQVLQAWHASADPDQYQAQVAQWFATAREALAARDPQLPALPHVLANAAAAADQPEQPGFAPQEPAISPLSIQEPPLQGYAGGFVENLFTTEVVDQPPDFLDLPQQEPASDQDPLPAESRPLRSVGRALLKAVSARD